MTVVAAHRVQTRDYALDAFRGLAVLAMVVDHLTAVGLLGPDVLRDTVGRLAMPMFFVLAGHLARSPRWRHAGVAVVGLLLPVAVPWIDSPNVLMLWALGVVVLWAIRLADLPWWLPVVLALTLAANGWLHADGYYPPATLLALMAVGSVIPRSSFAWASRVPGPVAFLGRFPVSVYVAHLLVLQGLLVAFS